MQYIIELLIFHLTEHGYVTLTVSCHSLDLIILECPHTIRSSIKFRLWLLLLLLLIHRCLVAILIKIDRNLNYRNLLKIMISISLSLSIAILLSVGIISTTVFAQQTSLDLTSPTITELYDGDKKEHCI